MNRNLLLILGLLFSVKLTAQADLPPPASTRSVNPDSLPKELIPFIIPKHEVLDFATGDLNGDKKPDVILILKDPNEDSIFEEQLARPLLILVRQADDRLKQIIRNDTAVMGRHDGGVFGDPYQEMDISQNGFSLYFYGGSSWRWAYQYRFDWKPAKQHWFLVLESESSFNSGDPEMTMKEVNIKEAELGEIPFRKFSPGIMSQSDTQWKVKAIKTFFYPSPELGSQPRKGYLVKGNIVTGIRHLKNFIEVSFENKKGEITDGFILRKDLVKLK